MFRRNLETVPTDWKGGLQFLVTRGVYFTEQQTPAIWRGKLLFLICGMLQVCMTFLQTRTKESSDLEEHKKPNTTARHTFLFATRAFILLTCISSITAFHLRVFPEACPHHLRYARARPLLGSRQAAQRRNASCTANGFIARNYQHISSLLQAVPTAEELRNSRPWIDWMDREDKEG